MDGGGEWIGWLGTYLRGYAGVVSEWVGRVEGRVRMGENG